MTGREMLTVFCYDVSSAKRRRRVAKILENSASRVQYSVFETRLSEAKAHAIAQRTAAELGDNDSLRVYVLGDAGERRSRTYGNATPIEPNGAFWLM
ncbi:MAG: CRISPR-associated endonuclease Cas2 [Pseudomonadota bacterium]